MKNAKRFGRYVISAVLIVCMLAGIGLTHISGYADEAVQEGSAAEHAATAEDHVSETASSDKAGKSTEHVEKAPAKSSSASADSGSKAGSGSAETSAPANNGSASAESAPKAGSGSNQATAPANTSSAPAESAPKAGSGSGETAAPANNGSAPAESAPKAESGSGETAAPANNGSAPAESAPKAESGSSETTAPANNSSASGDSGNNAGSGSSETSAPANNSNASENSNTEAVTGGKDNSASADNTSVSDHPVPEADLSGNETAVKAENNSATEVSDSAEAVVAVAVSDETGANTTASKEDVNSREDERTIVNDISEENPDNTGTSGTKGYAAGVVADGAETEKSEDPAFCYEVDFSFDGNKFVLQGDTSDELNAVLDQLGLSGEVSSVVSSNPELFSCEQVDGVWMISANSAFASDESLTVTLEDGNVLEIKANDDFAGNSSRKIMCVYDDETKTLTIKLADNEEVPVIDKLDGESDEERSERLSAYAVQDIGGETGLLKSLSSIVEKIVLMEGVTGIGWDENRPNSKGVFQGFTALTEVEASSTLVNIGWSAFRKCTNLKVFDFASCTNLETIRQQAFSTTALEEADMSECENLETIGRGAFEYDSSLKSVTIPTAVKAIDDTAFNNCTGIETVVYNAADYEYCFTNNSKDKCEWFSSKTFKASNSLTLEIGSDVEILPRGFFKAFVNAGEQVSFVGVDDGDPDTVSGRIVKVHEMAGDNGNEPFRNFPSEVIVDESGVLYKNNGNGIEMLYVSSGITQYTLPDEIIVDGEAFTENTVDYSSFGRVIRYSVAVDSRENITFEGSMPEFRASGRVLAVADTVNALSSDDLTGLTCTAVAEDGTIYRYELIGWLCGEDEIDLGAEVTLNGDGDVTLTARWSVTVIPAEDEVPETPEDAPSETPETPEDAPAETPETPEDVPAETPETPEDAPAETPETPEDVPAEDPEDAADVPVNAPVAAQTRTADNVPAVKTADNEVLQTNGEEIAVPGNVSDTVEELSVHVDTYEEAPVIEEILDEETPLAAQTESESSDILVLSLVMIMIIIAMFIYMIINKKQEENN